MRWPGGGSFPHERWWTSSPVVLTSIGPSQADRSLTRIAATAARREHHLLMSRDYIAMGYPDCDLRKVAHMKKRKGRLVRRPFLVSSVVEASRGCSTASNQYQ